MVRLAGSTGSWWHLAGTSAVVALLMACTASPDNVRPGTPAGTTQTTRSTCEPRVSFLPTRVTGEVSSATAINDAGWIAGWVAEDVTRVGRAVLWRDSAPPLDLGVRGVPYDINEEGAIAIQGGGGRNAFAAYLWRDGTLRRLQGTRSRPHVMVAALNDRGVVVGTVNRYDASNDRAATWRNGKLGMLAPPPGAKHSPYRALGVTSSGLVIGVGWSGPHPDSWWWDGGRVRALPPGVSGHGFGTQVDGRGRVVGFVAGRGEDDPGGPALKWRNVRSEPAPFLKAADRVTALHHTNGYLVGSARNRPFLSHLSSGRIIRLPEPPAPDGYTVDSTNANGVASGPSSYAPDGGITVVGETYVISENDGGNRAVVWTCAQNYP